MHSKDWIPEFKSPFKKKLEDFIKFKRSNGYAYRDPICYRLKELDTFFLSLNQRLLDKLQQVDSLVRQQ